MHGRDRSDPEPTLGEPDVRANNDHMPIKMDDCFPRRIVFGTPRTCNPVMSVCECEIIPVISVEYDPYRFGVEWGTAKPCVASGRNDVLQTGRGGGNTVGNLENGNALDVFFALFIS